jgi:hypothetical protein
MDKPRPGGPLVSFGDALGGQLLAQPGMLVVHVLPPFRRASSAVLHSPDAHGQVEPDLGVRVDTGQAMLASESTSRF